MRSGCTSSQRNDVYIVLPQHTMQGGVGLFLENTSPMLYNACQAIALHGNLTKPYIFIKTIKFLFT